VRRPEDGDALSAAHPGRITIVQLEVTDERQIAALDGALPAQLDALVNNAGVVVGSPIDAVPLWELRRQLEVSVVGQAAATQALLPRLRASRGRVVFVSSLSGRVATPLMGPYSASKFALEGTGDAPRMELASWGIRVILIEPAQTDTDLWRHAEEDLDESVAAISQPHRDLYEAHIAGFRRTIPRSQRVAVPAETVAAAIEKALTDRRPRARYVVGRGARAQALLAQLTPTPVLDRLLSAGLGVPRRR